jgi:RimJ/RimL family protein N-acetyltransferase
MARPRFEYAFELKNFDHSIVPGSLSEIVWRNPTAADKQILAELMFASYLGTIDYDGETVEDALKEVESYFSERSDQTWLGYSWLAFLENELAAACLVEFWQDRNAPLIAYIMTAPHWKGKHLATAALFRSLQTLADNKYLEARAVITEDNVPSEKIFTRIGFKRLSSD